MCLDAAAGCCTPCNWTVQSYLDKCSGAAAGAIDQTITHMPIFGCMLHINCSKYNRCTGYCVGWSGLVSVQARQPAEENEWWIKFTLQRYFKGGLSSLINTKTAIQNQQARYCTLYSWAGLQDLPSACREQLVCSVSRFTAGMQ